MCGRDLPDEEEHGTDDKASDHCLDFAVDLKSVHQVRWSKRSILVCTQQELGGEHGVDDERGELQPDADKHDLGSLRAAGWVLSKRRLGSTDGLNDEGEQIRGEENLGVYKWMRYQAQ